ncbi:MAG TPA: hypothetical protein VER17_04690 [Tepidisphaeraceae bacterium]|nr:hypothetical protein [Tepidisphaeraceae bacterium]
MHQTSRRRRRPRPAGYLIGDMIVALIVVAVLTVALTVAVTRQQRTAQRLAETRELARIAEAAMTAMQTGAAPAPPPGGTSVTVRREPAPAADVPGTAWATVIVTRGQGATELTGLVRADALPGGAP